MSALALRHALADLGALLPVWRGGHGPAARGSRPWEAAAARSATRVSFRFGLRGLRWGESGPVVLMAHGASGRPTQFRYVIEPILASGRRIIALQGEAGASPEESALALLEAAVEIPMLDAVVGHGEGATAAALALAQGLAADRAVLIAVTRSGVTPGDARLLVVHDLDDRHAPFSDGEALARACPGARLLATSGLGHEGVLTDAAVTQGVAEFLAGHAAGLTASQLRAVAM